MDDHEDDLSDIGDFIVDDEDDQYGLAKHRREKERNTAVQGPSVHSLFSSIDNRSRSSYSHVSIYIPTQQYKAARKPQLFG